MAAEDGRFRAVLEGETEASGAWTGLIHDCTLPTREEIDRASAAQGSVWTCKCGRKWKLTMPKGDRGHEKKLTWVSMEDDD